MLLSDQRHHTAINAQDGTFAVTPNHQGGTVASLAASSQGHAGMPIRLISSPRLFVDPTNQSLPLLEVTTNTCSSLVGDDQSGFVQVFKLVSDSVIGPDTWVQIGQIY